MSRAKLVVESASAEEIHKLLRKDEKYMVGVRLYAVYQIANGSVSRDLEKIYNVKSCIYMLISHSVLRLLNLHVKQVLPRGQVQIPRTSKRARAAC